MMGEEGGSGAEEKSQSEFFVKLSHILTIPGEIQAGMELFS